MMSKKFKIGDLVTCIKKGAYAITDCGVVCSVIGFGDNRNFLYVRVEEGRFKNQEYEVSSRLFDLVCNTTEATQEEVLSLMV